MEAKREENAKHRASKQRNSPPPQQEDDPDAQADEEWCRAKEREVTDTATDEKRAGDERHPPTQVLTIHA